MVRNRGWVTYDRSYTVEFEDCKQLVNYVDNAFARTIMHRIPDKHEDLSTLKPSNGMHKLIIDE